MASPGLTAMAIGAVACGAALAAAVRAEPAAVEHSTPEVRVERRGPGEAPEDPTAFTHVIEAEDYAGEDKRVEDLLEKAPGVRVRRFGGPGAPAEISIRGSSGSQVVVLLDGVRLNSTQSGGVDLSTIPSELVERIEVSRGGGSVQNGSDAIGGVVNLVTRRPSANPETRASGAAGSFETWQGSLSQTGRIGEVEALLAYDGFKTSGDWEFETLATGDPDDNDSADRINNRSETHSGLLKLARDVGDAVRIELSDSLFHGDEGRPGLDRARGGPERGQSRDGHSRRTRNVVQGRVLGAGLTPLDLDAELRAFHRFERRRFRDREFDPAVDSDDRESAYGGRIRLGTRFHWGPSEQAPSLGAELRRDEHDPKGTGFRSRRVLGLFAQHELSFLDRRVVIVPALRLDDSEDFDTEWIPRIGLALRPLPWLELRGNAERSYRIPNFDELFLDEGSLRGNPGLRPEDAVNLDAGLRLALAPAGPLPAVTLEAAVFQHDIDDTIVFQLVSPDVVAATNIRDVRTRGLELYGRVDLLGWLAVSGSWTELDTEIDGNDGELPGRPDTEYDLRLEIAPLDGLFKLVGELQHTGRYPVTEAGNATISDRTTYDTSLTVDVHRLLPFGERLGLAGLLFSVAATNVTDRAVRDALFFPQPGRTLTFRLEAWR